MSTYIRYPYAFNPTTAQTYTAVQTFNGGIKLQTTGATAATLNFYSDTIFTADFTLGAGVDGANTTGKIMTVSRLGNVVTLCFPSITNMTSGTTSVIFATAAATIPEPYRPPTSTAYKFPAQAISGGTLQNSGQIQVLDDGSIRIFKDLQESATFAAATVNCGVSAICVSYHI